MDRFIIKEPKSAAGFPQENQMTFLENPRSGCMPLKNLYYSSYPSNAHNIQQTLHGPQTMSSAHLGQTHTLPSGSGLGSASPTITQCHTSGIDPRYLDVYSDSSPQYILAGQQIQGNQPINIFGGDYQNRGLGGADRNKPQAIRQTVLPQVMHLGGLAEPAKVEEMPKLQPYSVQGKNTENQQSFQQKFPTLKKPNELDLIRNDVQMQMMTRSDKLKALNKGGPRAFSGPVEKVLKWHKTLQEIGILIIYEIVGKCVSVRPGERSAKNLVVRDDNGPAMQVVYYEIDFLLPELKPPCTVRVIGRMMAGTCRLQAFNVRPATGDDVTTLPRRAAVAAHHIAKLCKEYGHN